MTMEGYDLGASAADQISMCCLENTAETFYHLFEYLKCVLVMAML